MQYIQGITYNTLIYRKVSIHQSRKSVFRSIKKGFCTFQSLLCFVLTTDDAISATISLLENSMDGIFDFFVVVCL